MSYYVAGMPEDSVWGTVVPGISPFQRIPELSLPEPRAGAGVALYEGFIFVVCGDLGSNIFTNTVLKLELFAQQVAWVSAGSLPTPRTSVLVVVAGGKLFALGGNDNDDNDVILSELFEYDAVSNTWISLPETFSGGTVSRANAAIASYRDSFFVVGSTALYQYNTSGPPVAGSAAWRDLGATPIVFDMHVAVCDGDLLFVFGASDLAIRYYSILAALWTALAPLQAGTPFSLLSPPIVAEGHAIFWGGRNSVGQALTAGQAFHFATQTWLEIALPLPVPFDQVSAVLISF
jgi:hypothetical protein